MATARTVVIDRVDPAGPTKSRPRAGDDVQPQREVLGSERAEFRIRVRG